MKVDVSKFNCYLSTPKSISINDYVNLKEPEIIRSPNRTSFEVEDLGLICMSLSAWAHELDTDFNYPSYKKITEKYTIDFPDKELYIPYENIPYKIPFEYYSKACIDMLDFTIQKGKELDFTPRTIKFTLDCCGRLHVNKDTIEPYIYCIKKKIPEIQAEISLNYTYPTKQNQIELANKSLEPYFILNKSYENIYDYLAKKGTVAYKILKDCEEKYLEFFKNHIIEVNGYKSKSNYLAGYIFEDGSYLMFSDDIIYHEIFLVYIARKTEEYAEKNWIKVDDIERLHRPVAIYHSKLISPEAKATLNRLKKQYYFQEQDLDNL